MILWNSPVNLTTSPVIIINPRQNTENIISTTTQMSEEAQSSYSVTTYRLTCLSPQNFLAAVGAYAKLIGF